jgi:hypothetical protein
MLRGKRVWSLGYTIVGAVPPIVGVPPHPLGLPLVPMLAFGLNVTDVLPLTQPSLAVTVTVPPEVALGCSSPLAMVPAGVASERVAVQLSALTAIVAEWPSV